MKIVGHGIDVVELRRIQLHLSSSHDDWTDAIFTDDERAQADAPPNNISYFAGRYAAKEAIAKALGTGFSDNVTWLDVEILRRSSGAPEVRLGGGARDVANTLGITQWLVSISHSGDYATASAIAVAE